MRLTLWSFRNENLISIKKKTNLKIPVDEMSGRGRELATINAICSSRYHDYIMNIWFSNSLKCVVKNFNFKFRQR